MRQLASRDPHPVTTDAACTLSILACRFDVPYLELTIPHLVRACNYRFVERLLNIDVGAGTAKRGVATTNPDIDALRECGWRLVVAGVIDRVIEFDDSLKRNTALSRKHFGKRLPFARDCRGVPLWGWINALEACRTEYLVHFDCDMLLHQRSGHSWIADGIQLSERRPDVMFVLPLPGPPAADGRLFQKKGDNYQHDAEGFYRFKSFTSRKFLVKRSRFEKLLPLRPLYISWKRRLLQAVTGRNSLRNWETMVSRRLAASSFIRADLDSPCAWTLHSHDHGPHFVAALPSIIQHVERGDFPTAQAGRYDLLLEAWLGNTDRTAGQRTDLPRRSLSGI